MIRSRWLTWLALVLIGGPLFALTAQAERFVMNTATVTPLKVVFFSPRENILSGRVLGDGILEGEPYNVQFSLLDKGKAEVLKKTIRWESGFQRTDRVIVPFQFDLTQIPISGKTMIYANVLDRNGQILATGRGEGLVFKPERPAQVSNLDARKEDNMIKGSFLFVNNYKERNAQYEARLREHSQIGVVVATNKGELLNFPAEERNNLTFEIELPTEPEVYWLEVLMVNKDGEALTGVVRDHFLVEGDFAEITAFTISPEHFLLEGETVNFHVAGVAPAKDEALTLDIQVDQIKNGEKVDTFSSKKNITLEHERFAEKFSFSLKAPASQFNAHIKVLRGRKVLDEKMIQSEIFKKNTFFESVVQVIQNPTDSKNFEVWMVTILTIAVIVLILGLVKGRKKQTLNLLILAFGLCWTQNGHAEMVTQWLLPESEVAYNPIQIGFNSLSFDGRAVDNVTFEGLFEQELIETNVILTKDDEEVRIPINRENITLSEFNTRYTFLFSFSEENFANVESVDGQWNIQIEFTVEGDITYVTNWDGYIMLDITAPEISITPQVNVDQFDGDAIAVNISCNDGEAGAGCINDTLTTYVRGNFCDDANICNPNAIRGFEVCDTVGNCTDPAENLLTITQFDPIPPQLQGGIRFGDGDGLTGKGGFEANKVKANPNFIFELLGANDDVDAERLLEFQALFDTNACGTTDQQNDTFLANNVILSWTTEDEGEDLMGYFIERDTKGGDEVWNQMGSIEKNETGEYTFTGISINDANNYYYRLRIGSLGGEFFSAPIEVNSPLAEAETLGENTIVSTITSLSASKGDSWCMTKEIMCVENNQRDIKDITQQICPKNEFDIQLESLYYAFPYTLPFPLSAPAEGTFPIEFPTYLSE